MDLFHIQEEGRGMVFWHPKGWTLYRTLQNYVRRRMEAEGYVEVKTPQVLDRSLLGALRPLGEVPRQHVRLRDGRGRDAGAQADELPGPRADLQPRPAVLPRTADPHGGVRRPAPLRKLRLAAWASCGCAASSQDDAHIFCTEDQIEAESKAFVELLQPGLRRPGGGAAIGEAGAAPGPALRHGRAMGRSPRTRWSAPPTPRASRWSGSPTRAPSMAPSWSSTCATPSAAPGSAARCSSTTSCPSVWTPATSARTAASTGR